MNATAKATLYGNKAIVQQVIDSFFKSDIETALSLMTEDVQMGWPGFFDLAPGKTAVREFFKDIPEMVSARLEDIIEDGDKLAATGSVTSREKDGTLKQSFFCDIYALEAGKIKSIKEYMVFEQKV